jgi:hypothetical protein
LRYAWSAAAELDILFQPDLKKNGLKRVLFGRTKKSLEDYIPFVIKIDYI